MNCILYYSRYCDVCKKYLQILSKSEHQKDIHFICIDKRTKDSNNKTYIILENSQKIILPDNVTKVPALLLLNQGYEVLFGDQILQYLKPVKQQEIKRATQNNMEPMAFSLGGGCIASDQYSFLDMDSEELNTKGSGGMRQMHNYVPLNYSDTITTPTDEHDYKEGRSGGNQEMTVEKLQQMRDQELSSLSMKK